jgi:CheY-like chemotaxis protein
MKSQTSNLKAGAGVRAVPPVTVLHIDDDPNDTELLRAAARRAHAAFMLHNAEDTEQAIAYLSGKGSYADRKTYPVPDLILLDLKMPRGTGFELLRWIRSQSQSPAVPVVILSGSELQADVQAAYAGGANSYLVKPLGFDELVMLVRNISAMWLPPTALAGASRSRRARL